MPRLQLPERAPLLRIVHFTLTPALSFPPNPTSLSETPPCAPKLLWPRPPFILGAERNSPSGDYQRAWVALSLTQSGGTRAQPQNRRSQRPLRPRWVPFMPPALGWTLPLPAALITPGLSPSPHPDFLTPRLSFSCSTLSPRKDCMCKPRPVPIPFCLPYACSSFPKTLFRVVEADSRA